MWLGLPAYAQLEVSNADEPPFDPVRLIEDVFLGEGVDIVNVQFDGPTGAIGYFKGGSPSVGLEEGIILTTGRVETAGAQYGVNSPSNLNAVFDNGSTVVDPNLAQASSGDPTQTGDIYNVSRYTITFVPKGDRVKFRYVFASEEYPEFVCSQYNDIFGFFIEGPGIAGPYANAAENIALVPGTNLPVSINTINPGTHGAQGAPNGCDPPDGSLAYTAYYVDNSAAGSLPVFDGMTTVLTAEASVIPCQTYTMQLSLGDVNDETYDTGVFLEAKSFSTPTLDVEVETLSLAGEVAEGCEPGEFVFKLNEPAATVRTVPYTVGGTATPSADYAPLSGVVTIPAGATEARIPVFAVQDGIAEPLETITITVQVDPCSTETVTMKLVDRAILPVPLVLDTTVCPGEPVTIDATIPVTVDLPVTFTNNQFELLTVHDQSYWKDINVTGIDPVQLRGGLVLEVCLNIAHNNTEDLDLYLYSPDGKYIELSTDNGGPNPGGYDQVCFRSDAIDPIDVAGGNAPISGNYLPEGDWSALWNNSGANANGTWRLQIIDDSNGFGGVFSNWSITFAPVYEVVYDWSPTTDLSCTDCPSPIATPSATTTYTVTATDSYGCTETVDARIAIFPAPQDPAISCSTGFDQLTWTWPADTAVVEFQVSINGGAFQSVGLATSHTETGLGSNETVTIEVAALGVCTDRYSTNSCTTQNCSPFSLSATPTAASCAGEADGQVTLAAGGGISPWTYTVDGVSNTTGDFTGLVAGSYNATVVDANGCGGSTTFTVTEPLAIGVITSVSPPKACGDGYEANANGNAGSGPPFTYVWSDGQTGPTVSYTVGGRYYVTVTDAAMCTQIDSVDIPVTAAMTATFAADSISCAGGSDGVITVNASSSFGGLTYSIGGPFVASNTFTGLAAGTYTVTASDALGCTVDTTLTLGTPPALTSSVATEPVTCFGESDGRLIVTAGGGTAPYSYLWSTGETSDTLTTAAGTHSVQITDAAGCVETASGTIAQPSELQLSLTAQAAGCFGTSTGTLTASTTGGNPPFTFVWSDGVTTLDSVRTGIPEGTYTVTATDAQGCVVASSPATVSEPTALGASHTSQPVTCAGSSTGAIDLNVFGGTPPYAYLWSDGSTAEDRSGLPAGTYQVSVTDANACPFSYTVVLDAPGILDLSFVVNAVSCYEAADGSITTTVSGGQSPYFYEWTGPNGYAFFGSNPTLLNVGAYDLAFRDSYGCTFDTTIVITQPDPISLATSRGDTICAGADNGIAEVIVTGGTSPFTYDWDNGETTAEARMLEAGVHQVVVTDANGCDFSADVEILSLQPMELTLSQSGVACYNDSNGVAELVAVSYGQTSGQLTSLSVMWDSDPSETNLTYQGLGGTQEVTVTATDVRGCTGAASIIIASPAELRGAVTKLDDLSCYESNDGEARVDVAGGTAGYAYRWLSGTNTITAGTVSDLSAGTHAVEIEDANGCLDTAQVTLLQPDSLMLVTEIKEVNCLSRFSGELTTDVSGGTQPYSYQWSNGATQPEITGLAAGTYEIVVTDDNGCSKLRSYEVTKASEVELEASAEGVTCHGDEDGSLSLSASGGNGPYEYSIPGVSWLRFGDFRYLEPGDYWALAQDRDGCPSDTVYLTVAEPAPFQLETVEEISVDLGDEAELTVTPIAAQGNVSYLWMPNDEEGLFSCSTCSQTSIYPTYQGFVTVQAIDEQGCEADASVRVRITKAVQVMVPTGFTPNDDGDNDRLLVHGKTGTQVLEFMVFDRWGNQVHMSENYLVNNPTQGWDGRLGDRDAPGGIYIWKARVRYLDGIETALSGQTTLIR